MTNTSNPTMESLISVCANDENFYAVVSNLQSLYTYLQQNPSPRCEDDYVRLMAHLLENYLDTKKTIVLTSAFRRNDCSSQ